MIVLENAHHDKDHQWQEPPDEINNVKTSFDKKIRTEEERARAVEHLARIKLMLEKLRNEK